MMLGAVFPVSKEINSRDSPADAMVLTFSVPTISAASVAIG